jgi:hypothetical protein
MPVSSSQMAAAASSAKASCRRARRGEARPPLAGAGDLAGAPRLWLPPLTPTWRAGSDQSPSSALACGVSSPLGPACHAQPAIRRQKLGSVGAPPPASAANLAPLPRPTAKRSAWWIQEVHSTSSNCLCTPHACNSLRTDCDHEAVVARTSIASLPHQRTGSHVIFENTSSTGCHTSSQRQPAAAHK